ncbi:MAG TPA: cytochrome P450 [Tepidisphaeraceae bacterium]|jgi:cytochrome P450|nr:cytochrome P450 [Tepidisphaeraceae bacterium]
MLDMLRLRLDTLNFLASLATRGDFTRFGPKNNVVLVSHPDLIREVLVTQAAKFIKGPALRSTKSTLGEGLLTSEGDFHKRQRRIIQPAFHATHVATYGQTMVQFTDRLSGAWQDGQTVDIHEAATRLTLEIVAKTLFDAEVEQDIAEIGRAMTASVELFPILLLPFGNWLARLPLPPVRRFHHTWPKMTQTIERFIAERTASGATGNDLLSVLIRATDPEESAGDGGGYRMSPQQLRDEAITLFTAGHETTANGLTYAFHLIAHYPEVQQKLHAELDAALAGRKPEAKDLDALPYTRAIVSEAMRAYPPVWTVGREANDDVQLGEHTLKKGAIVLTSQWVAHHDARWWPRPNEFDPDRWLTPDPDRPRYAYFPFAGGPRSCIGEAFAWMEMILVLATIAQRWSFEPQSPRELRLAPSITLRPKDAVRVRVTPR